MIYRIVIIHIGYCYVCLYIHTYRISLRYVSRWDGGRGRAEGRLVRGASGGTSENYKYTYVCIYIYILRHIHICIYVYICVYIYLYVRNLLGLLETGGGRISISSIQGVIGGTSGKYQYNYLNIIIPSSLSKSTSRNIQNTLAAQSWQKCPTKRKRESPP